MQVISSVVPDPICTDAVSMNGVIRVTWFYVHTGGLPLTDTSVDYSYLNGSSEVIEPVSIGGVNVTIVEVSNLVAGLSYTFMISYC